jgi:hypothetical protein
MYIDKDSRGKYSINELTKNDMIFIKAAIDRCSRDDNTMGILLYEFKEKLEFQEQIDNNERKEK